MNEAREQLLTEAIKKYCKANGKKYPGYAGMAFEAGANWALTIPITQKEEAKTVEGKTPEEIFEQHLDMLKMKESGGYSKRAVLQAFKAYSSQQNKALMEENERLRSALQWVVDNEHYETTGTIINSCLMALEPTKSQ